MKFGIFYELQLPRPWGPDDERQLYQNALTQVELADKLGYDYAWEVEHHFLEEYSHSPSPEVFLGAASQRTSHGESSARAVATQVEISTRYVRTKPYAAGPGLPRDPPSQRSVHDALAGVLAEGVLTSAP